MAGPRVGESRRLEELDGIGPAMLADLERLGVLSVAALARRDPRALYDRLCDLTGQRQDPCVLDTFACAVAQARDPRLPAAQRRWWWWSRRRLAEGRSEAVAVAAGHESRRYRF
jgi:Pathogenicity locus